MRIKILVAFSSFMLLTACQAKNTAEVNQREALQQEGNRVLLSNKQDLYEMKPMSNTTHVTTTKFGYSRKQKSDLTSGNDTSRIAYVNRETLAKIITDMAIKLPDVTDAATFVTDDEVFIIYRANTTDPRLVADQVKKTGLSVVPSYYHVYVSTEQKLITQIEGLKSGKLNDKEYTQTLDMLIREMHKNPHIDNQQNDSLHNMIKK
ncbi:YhcN/YlaJ family sporulation lipoprotein [Microbacteriaceae bacterium 4G12]